MLKQIDPKLVRYDGIEFAIYPFPAMTAANISGNLAKFIGPMIAAALPLFGGGGNTEEEIGESAVSRLFSMSNKDLLPMVDTALSVLDGDNVQRILNELLVKYGNINCEYEDDNGETRQEKLTRKLLDEIFIGHLDSMLFLAIDVVKLNFADFFTNLLRRYGSRQAASTFRTSKSMDDSGKIVSVL